MSQIAAPRCPHCLSAIEAASTEDGLPEYCPACRRSMTPLSDGDGATEAPAVRRTFHRFELQQMVGEGAFGTVWRAFDTALDRVVALKIGRFDGTRGEARQIELIAREARAAAQLGHPGIVQIFDSGVEGGLAYIAARYVEGEDLKRYLKTHGPLSPRNAAGICLRLADALAHAHDAGVIHRDLKPSNILIDRDGNPHITDFGLAKRETGDITVTLRGQPLGTPAYMSPEQAMGENRYIDRRSDIYSLGVILFELLTGEAPFQGELSQLLLRILTREPPRPRSLRDSIPVDLETICLKCLEKNPQRRYPSAHQLAADLRRYLNGEPISARPVGFWERAIKWSRRNPGWATVVAGAALAVAGVIGGGAFHTLQLGKANRQLEAAIRQAKAERRTAQEQTLLAEARRVEAEEASRVLAERELAARRLLYVDDVRQAHEFWKMGRLDEMDERLSQHLPGGGLVDIRGFEWHYLNRLCRRDPIRAIEAHHGPVYDIAYSPDGRFIASGGEEGRVRIHDATGTVVREAPLSIGTVESVEFSPDGKFLAAGGGKGIVEIRRAADWNLESQIPAHNAGITAVLFSPDGRRLVTASEDGTVAVWEFPAGQLVRRSTPSGSPVESVAVSPDGELLAATNSQGMLRVTRLDDGEPAWEYAHEQPARGVCFSRNGLELATACHDGLVRVFPRDSATPRLILQGFSEPVQSVAFGEDDQFIAAADKEGLMRVWDVDSGVLRDVARNPGGRVFALAFSPTERFLAAADRAGFVRQWSMSVLAQDRLSISTNQVGDLKVAEAGKVLVAAYGSHVTCLDLGETTFLKRRPFETESEFFRVPLRWRIARGTKAVAAAHRLPLLACGDGLHRLSLVELRSGSPRGALPIAGAGYSASAMTFSPDDAQLLSASFVRGVELRNLNDTAGAPRTIDAGTTEVGQAVFSPDGSQILIGGNKTVAVYSMVDHSVRIIDSPSFRVRCAAFAADGQLAVTGGQEGTLDFWSVPSWKKIRTVKTGASEVWSVDFAPDGRTLAVGTNNHMLELWQTDTFQRMLSLPFRHAAFAAVAFAPSGEFLAVGMSSLAKGDPFQGSIEILRAK